MKFYLFDETSGKVGLGRSDVSNPGTFYAISVLGRPIVGTALSGKIRRSLFKKIS